MKIKKIIVLFIIIAVLIIPFSCYAMSPEEFFNTYDYEYKYMIKYSNGNTNYFSCENPVTFSMSIYNKEGEQLKSGNILKVNYSGTIYHLHNSGTADSHIGTILYMMADSENLIGYDYVDVYKRSGSSFFLPNDLKLSPFRQILAGLIPILGLIVLLIAFRKAWEFLRSQLTS